MKLKVEAGNGVTEQITVLTITSYEPIYRLAWLFNQQFGWNLAESETLSVIDEECKVMRQFPVFSWGNAESGTSYYLVQNNEEQGSLIRIVDYWLRIENAENAADIALKIKGLAEIQFLQELKPTNQNKKLVIFRNPLYQSNL